MDDAKALVALSIELVLESRDYDAMTQLADFVVSSHEGLAPDLPLAKKLYEGALKIKPDYDLAKGNLGELLRKEQHGLQAKAIFEELLEHDPINYFALIGLGQLFDFGTPDVPRNNEQAEKYYKRCIQIYPTHCYSLSCLAEFYRRTDKLQQAESYFLRAIQADPQDDYSYAGLASTYYKMKEYEKAGEFVKNALYLNSTDELALEVQLALIKIGE